VSPRIVPIRARIVNFCCILLFYLIFMHAAYNTGMIKSIADSLEIPAMRRTGNAIAIQRNCRNINVSGHILQLHESVRQDTETYHDNRA